MVEYESNGCGKGMTIFFAVFQSLMVFGMISNIFGILAPTTLTYRLGRALTALGGIAALTFYILILSKPAFLGERPHVNAWPLLAAVLLDIAGGIVIMVGRGNVAVEATTWFFYGFIYLLYSFVEGIRPYKPVGGSKNAGQV